jgi:hypothetical protein
MEATMHPEDRTPRTVRIRKRLGKRLIGGLLVGVALGIGIGIVVGSTVYRAGSSAMWAVIIAAAVFAGTIGAFLGGMASLESPDPGLEPSQFDDPLKDPQGLISEEHDEGLEPTRHDPPDDTTSRRSA